jgi:hypothetical protein
MGVPEVRISFTDQGSYVLDAWASVILIALESIYQICRGS